MHVYVSIQNYAYSCTALQLFGLEVVTATGGAFVLT